MPCASKSRVTPARVALVTAALALVAGWDALGVEAPIATVQVPIKEFIAAFNRLYPRVPFTIVSEMPEAFLRHRIPAPLNRLRRGAFDVGVVQFDSIRGDLPATLRALGDLRERRR